MFHDTFLLEEGHWEEPSSANCPSGVATDHRALRAGECGCLEDEGQIMELGRAKGSCPSSESFLGFESYSSFSPSGLISKASLLSAFPCLVHASFHPPPTPSLSCSRSQSLHEHEPQGLKLSFCVSVDQRFTYILAPFISRVGKQRSSHFTDQALRCQEVMRLAPGHKASGKQSKDLNSGWMTCQTPSSLLIVPAAPPSSGFCDISTTSIGHPVCTKCHIGCVT